MPPRKLTERNLALHNLLTGDPKRPPRTPSQIAEPGSTANESIDRYLSSRNLTRPSSAMSGTTACYERERSRLNPEKLAAHDASMRRPGRPRSSDRMVSDCGVDGAQYEYQRPGLTVENLARHNAEIMGEPSRGQTKPSNAAQDDPIKVGESASSYSRRHENTGDGGDESELRGKFDYGNIGWGFAEHREGRWGRLEPRAGQKK